MSANTVTTFSTASGPAFGPEATITPGAGVSIHNVSHIFEGRGGKDVHALDRVNACPRRSLSAGGRPCERMMRGNGFDLLVMRTHEEYLGCGPGLVNVTEPRDGR